MAPQTTTRANTATDAMESTSYIQVHEVVKIEVDTVMDENAALKERIFALETTLREADNQVHKITAENHKGVAQNLRLMQAIAQLQNSNDELTKQANDLKASNVNLDKINKYTLAMWKRLYFKHKKLLNKRQEQETTIEQLQIESEQRYSNLQMEFVQSLQTNEDLIQAKSKLRAENIGLTVELKRLQINYEDMEAAYKNLEDEHNRQLAPQSGSKRASERQDDGSAITLIDEQHIINLGRSNQQRSLDCKYPQRSTNMQAENSCNEFLNRCRERFATEPRHGQGKLEINNISSLRSNGGNISSCQDNSSRHGALDETMLVMELHNKGETVNQSWQPHPCVSLHESESRSRSYCSSAVAYMAGDPANDKNVQGFQTDHEATVPETTTSSDTDQDVSMEISEEESDNLIDCVFTPDQDVEMDISEVEEMPTEKGASALIRCPEITLITSNIRNDTGNCNEQMQPKSDNISHTSAPALSTKCDTVQSNAKNGGSDITMSHIEGRTEWTEDHSNSNVEETPQNQRSPSVSDFMMTISIVAETTISATAQGDDGDVKEETDDSSSGDSDDSDDVVLSNRKRVGSNITSRLSPIYETITVAGGGFDSDRIPGRKPGKVVWSAPRMRTSPRMVRKEITTPSNAPPAVNARPTVSTHSL
ncbi:hypothetical protein BDD12DRAFT_941124 [Trichophaea hybrida]|nr:hypothetical protein BDD12DRAFT_941124 [Trichophaea hybrida]